MKKTARILEAIKATLETEGVKANPMQYLLVSGHSVEIESRKDKRHEVQEIKITSTDGKVNTFERIGDVVSFFTNGNKPERFSMVEFQQDDYQGYGGAEIFISGENEEIEEHPLIGYYKVPNNSKSYFNNHIKEKDGSLVFTIIVDSNGIHIHSFIDNLMNTKPWTVLLEKNFNNQKEAKESTEALFNSLNNVMCFTEYGLHQMGFKTLR